MGVNKFGAFRPCLRAASRHLCLLQPGAQSPHLHYHSHGTALLRHCKLPPPVPWFPCQLPALPIAETLQPPFSHFIAGLSQGGSPAQGLSPRLAWWSQRGSSVPSAQAGPKEAGCPFLVLDTRLGPGPPDATRTALIPRRRARPLSLTFPLLLPCLQPSLPPAASRGLGCLRPWQCEAGHPATCPAPPVPLQPSHASVSPGCSVGRAAVTLADTACCQPQLPHSEAPGWRTHWWD